ncbi:serine--tRNA ligase [Candidatus Peregrinibacteria bacterium]|jgi:seryl-tRNA synthetase|nr:serine--tRNA ligase [Candidatus Peregrinibacteria bacterium]MBT4631608.1 serine--tRNA ligase [Candidatus Peregrinibacteria bacterium]MBT5823695.1 serine--tRNA ligase [Candidatus Peregrinibacteria bacterium]
MLDPKYILENPDEVKESARKKGVNFDVDAFIKLDEKRRQLQTECDALRAEKNAANEKIAKLDGDEKQKAIAKMKNKGDEEKKLTEELKEAESKWTQLLLTAPGKISPETPEGKDDTENKELYTWGDLPKPDFEFKDHVALGLDLDILDIERGVKIAGSRNYFLKGDGALLELAILQYTLHKLASKGFTAFLPPLLVNYEAMQGTSYFPGGEEQTYTIESDDKYLIGTSEVPVASYHSGEILDESELPKLYAGYSYCFRREAGTYGKDTHGLYRIHQFQKVEQVVLCKNDMEESAKMHEMLLKNAEEVLQDLKLPYRVVAVCSGDMGQGQYYKNDIETWMPSRDSYGETHSCSTFLDFQSRRLNIKYKNAEGKKQFVHTLNNTCIASPRILIPLLEMYQNADGSVTIPEPLRPWMGGKDKIEA